MTDDSTAAQTPPGAAASSRFTRLSRLAATAFPKGTAESDGARGHADQPGQNGVPSPPGGPSPNGVSGRNGGQNGVFGQSSGPGQSSPGQGGAGQGIGARFATGSDSATTANLPVIGGPDDPYVDRNSRASRGSTGVPPVANPGAVSARSAGQAPAAPPPGGGGRDAAAVPTVRRARGERTPRRARLQLRHFNVWTVFKFSVVLAVALFFVWLIVVAVLYGTLNHLQVIEKINKTVRTVENDSSTKDVVTARIVFTSAFLIGLLDLVLFIALTTIGAVMYNLCADLVGGVEVTLAERD